MRKIRIGSKFMRGINHKVSYKNKRNPFSGKRKNKYLIFSKINKVIFTNNKSNRRKRIPINKGIKNKRNTSHRINDLLH